MDRTTLNEPTNQPSAGTDRRRTTATRTVGLNMIQTDRHLRMDADNQMQILYIHEEYTCSIPDTYARMDADNMPVDGPLGYREDFRRFFFLDT